MLDAAAAAQPETMASNEYTDTLNLLDMPDDIIVEILSYVPPENLHDCIKAHPRLREITQWKYFKNKYIQIQLRLQEVDLKYDVLPKSFSAQSERWYFKNASLARRYAAKPDRYRPTLNKSHEFFPLAVFKHLYQSWLIETGCLKLSKPKSNKLVQVCTRILLPAAANKNNNNNAKGIEEVVITYDTLLDENLPDLPIYVTRFLTKLFLTAPGFLESSLHMRYMYLRKGGLVYLTDVIEFFTAFQGNDCPRYFKPHFSLELVSGDEREKEVNAIFVLFSPDKCVLWLGAVSEFPQCLHISTNALKIIDTNLSQNLLKTKLGKLERAFEKAFTPN